MRKTLPPLFAGLLSLASAAPSGAFDQIQFLEPAVSIKEAGKAVGAAAARDRYYVVDQKAAALLIYDGAGKLLKSVGGNKAFSSPSAVALDPEGEVLVADTGNSRIVVLDPAGSVLRTIGSKGSDPGRLSGPSGVAVARDGRVFVADTGNDRIQVFTREGIFLFGFGAKGKENGQFKEPMKVVLDAADCVYVYDEGNERVQKFGPQMKFERSFAALGQDLLVDDYGFVYMLDKDKAKVKELGPDGFVLGGFGTLGKDKGQFKKPEAVLLGPDGLILVVDSGNKRISRVRLANKLKVKKLSHDLTTRLLISGPSRTLKLQAGALAAAGGTLYAYLSKQGQFVGLGPGGAELLRFGTRQGKGEDATKGSSGFAVSPKYGVYASDTEGSKVQSFDEKGAFRSTFGLAKGFMESRGKEGNVKEPGGVAVDESEQGKVYVADTGNRRVDAYSPDGTFLFAIGPMVGPYELKEPVAVAWDPEGFVYVLDKGLKRVFKCEPSGGYLKAWGGEGEGVSDFDEPVGLVYDGRSYLYVLDRGFRRVAVFDRDGRWVTNFFAGGADERSLDKPAALAVFGSSLAVSDPARERVAVFDLHPRLAPPLAVSTKAAEGEVDLQWTAAADPWIRSYRVFRSSDPLGPFAEAGRSEKPAFRDSKVEAYQTWFYRVAVEAATGDMGPASRSVEVLVPGAFNRAPIEISTVTLGNIFSSNYKYYKSRRLGSVTVSNNLNLPFQNVKVSFRLKDFMDFATERTIERLGPKEKVEVDLVATLNNKILEVTEDTPIQAEIAVTYFEKGAKQELSQALPLKVYSRNAITWEDPQRIANYVTPKDPPALDLVRALLREPPPGPAGTEYLGPDVVSAMRVWAGLGAAGVRFMPSPNNPFEKVSQDPAFPLDYTQFPRETLKRKSGQCDDLATLLASMLEGATVKTALLDYPGHIALMFDTGSNDPLEIGIPAERLVEYDGTYWVPLEATMIGSPFPDAAQKALSDYNELSKQGKAGILDLRKAWATYEPATLPPEEQPEVRPDAAAYAKGFEKAASEYVKLRRDFLAGALKRSLAENPDDLEAQNRLGILHAQHGEAAEAADVFNKVLAAAPGDPSGLNNLGSLAYLKGDYEGALGWYEKALESETEDAGVWMNAARAAVKLGRREQARLSADKALALDDGLKGQVEALLKQ